MNSLQFSCQSLPFFSSLFKKWGIFLQQGFGREKSQAGSSGMCKPWAFAAISRSSRETWYESFAQTEQWQNPIVSFSVCWYWSFRPWHNALMVCRWFYCSYQIHGLANAEWIGPDHFASSTGAATHQNNRWSWNQSLVGIGCKDKEERRWKEEER